MTARRFSRLAAIVFAVIAMLQLARAVLGWAATVDMGAGPFHVPLWPSWVAFLVFAALAWLGFATSRGHPEH